MNWRSPKLKPRMLPRLASSLSGYGSIARKPRSQMANVKGSLTIPSMVTASLAVLAKRDWGYPRVVLKVCSPICPPGPTSSRLSLR